MSVPPMLVRRQLERHRTSRHRSLRSSMVLAAVVLLSGCAANSGSTMPPAPAGGTAAALDAAAVSADTSVPELLRFATTTVDGQQFDGRQLAGKPALVWFWASWCPICAGQAPLMKLLKKDLDGTGVQVVTIAGLGGSTADERSFIKTYSMDTMTNLDDQSGDLYARFGVTSQATYLALHRDGTLDPVTQTTLTNLEKVAKQLTA